MVPFQTAIDSSREIWQKTKKLYNNLNPLEKFLLLSTSSENTVMVSARMCYDTGIKKVQKYLSNNYLLFLQNNIPHGFIFLEGFLIPYLFTKNLSEEKRVLLGLGGGLASQVSIELFQLMQNGTNPEFLNDILIGMKTGSFLAAATYGVMAFQKIREYKKNYSDS